VFVKLLKHFWESFRTGFSSYDTARASF